MTTQRPLDQELDVTFDGDGVHVRVLGTLPPHLNADFQWADIERVCWQDGGLGGADLVHLVLRPDQRVVQVPTEARGGHVFFGELTRRDLFPEAVWRDALGDTSGGVHCWPPYPEEVTRQRWMLLVNIVIVIALSIGALRARSWRFAALAAAWAVIYVIPTHLVRRLIWGSKAGGGTAGG